MHTPAKRNSVTYDANRIRVPPETPVSRNPGPGSRTQNHGLRVVSDDLVQRQTHPPRLAAPRSDSSPDGFVFSEPPAFSGRNSASLRPHSPSPPVASVSPASTGSNSLGKGVLRPSLPSRTSSDFSPHASESSPDLYASKPLSRSVSRVRSQFAAGKRHSSCPSTGSSSPGLKPASEIESPSETVPLVSENAAFSSLPSDLIPHSFSFSAADASVLEVSPARTQFTTESEGKSSNPDADKSSAATAAENAETANLNVPESRPLDVSLAPESLATDAFVNMPQASPPKSIASSLGSNPIGQIIGTYEYSSSSIALPESGVKASTGAPANAKSHPLSATPPFHNINTNTNQNQNSTQKFPTYPPKHDRQDSQSSAISSASSSTLTSAQTQQQQQRFVRYVMSTQANTANWSTRWGMESVLSWLDTNGFSETWKNTFRRNEISGNRFLELGNYDAGSAVWRQLSQTLGADGDSETVGRFIALLSQTSGVEDIAAANSANSANSASSGTVPPFLSSLSSSQQSAYLDLDPYSKLENRKSSSTLWAQSATPAVSTKQRPFSYIDLGTPQKPAKEHGKFFRKHARLSSSDSNKDVSTPTSSGSKPAGEASSGSSNLGFKKSGILSTLRKYGGEKAAGIVKQVQSNPGSSKQFSHKRMGSGFSLHKKTDSAAPKAPEIVNRGSQSSLQLESADTSARSPNSLQSFNVINADEQSANGGMTASLKSARRLSLEDVFDRDFLPSPRETSEDVITTILLTRDNHSFVPFPLEAKLLGDMALLRSKFIQKLDMLDIGEITYHLTDFDSQCGAALPHELLLSALSQGLVSKLKIEQSFRSPDRHGTFSSTSSDSKSFDTSAGGKMYPETPQYLLQHSNDKGMDYMNFKDMNKPPRKPSKDIERPVLSSLGSSERVPHGAYPINLSMPQSKRLQQVNAANPALNKRGLPLINTSHPVISSEADSRDKPSGSPSSFTIVRREGREIDFDKRRMNPTENKAPRLIPNIYSSSVTDSSVSPISASTIHALKDEKAASSPTTIRSRSGTRTTRALSSASDFEKSASFVARRKAPPPPPTASNSLKVKKSIGSLSISSGSNRSEVYHLSNDSIDSFRSSQVGASTLNIGAKTFDFSDAPSLELPSHPSANNSDEDGDNDDDDDDDDVFFKPLQTRAPKLPVKEVPVSKPSLSAATMGINDLVSEHDKMEMRPSVDEVYDNLERYFPNTILDKPIIDAYPDSPNVVSIAGAEASKPTLRKPPISRTFSNANISPVHPEKEPDDQVFYGDGPRLRRRMKTIRVVAHEAYKKRLASQKAVKESDSGKPIRKETMQTVRGALTRANTKLWGQKVVEVTSDDIEKGIVGRIRKIANTSCEEFAWVKGELIGRGSFGSVFLALNVTTGEMLAVKQVHVTDSTKASSDGLDAFHKEVETMKDLDHLNIVQYLGFEQNKQTYSLFLEYVAGGSISSCLKTYGKFDEPLVKFITRQVLEGLKYLHENGILHRDLKADNLLLEIDGVCKISDFGISKKSQDIYSNNAEMSMQGTVFWMAPEVIHSMVEEKKQGYSAKVDIWSLGCVMLEMFAGQRPWSNEAVVSAIYKLGKTKLAPPIPADVSQEAKDFLNKCFTIDSEKRPTAAELLDHDFMKVDKDFKFCQTRLSEIIKNNPSKKVAQR